MARILRREHFDITFHNDFMQARRATDIWAAQYPEKEIIIVETLGGPVELWAAKKGTEDLAPNNGPTT